MNHRGKCAHPHGHNGIVRILIGQKELREDGMVVDFAELKRTVGQWIEERLDHRMILQQGDPLVEVLQKMHEPLFLMDENPTAENLAKLIFKYCQQLGFPVVAVEFCETERCSARYSEEVSS